MSMKTWQGIAEDIVSGQGVGRRQDSAGGGVCEAHLGWELKDSHEVGRA